MKPSTAQQILYIEDSPGEALLIKKHLNRQGYSVTLGYDGESGLDHLHSAAFSAVLIDLKLPDISGLEVLRTVVEQEPTLPAIVVTGRGDEETAIAAMKLGARDYIVKDVYGEYIELIPAVIERAMRQQQIILEKQWAEEIARRREAILKSVAFAAKMLLQSPTWSGQIDEILARLGKATQVNRVYLVENEEMDSNDLLIQKSFEWVSEDISARTTSWVGMSYTDIGLSEFLPLLKNGQLVNGLVRNFPESVQTLFKQRNVTSTIIVPIFAGDSWWGAIGFECCHMERVWETAEIDTLQIAANTLGTALQRQQTEAALYQAQKQESIGLLVGGIAHDFNNLLTGILGQTSLSLLKLPVDSPARGNLTRAIQTTEQAALLVQQLLGYAGKGKYQVRPINLNELIRDNLGLLETIIRKRAKLTLNLTPDLPTVEADLSQMQQVVMNLVVNAAEASEDMTAGQIQIKTRLSQTDTALLGITQSSLPPGRYVCLEIIDNGCGIKPSILNQIFDPFFSTKSAGRGLGLSAALGITLAHGGIIQVDTQPGKGSHFRLFLSATEKAAESPETTQPARGPIEGCILLIDDEDGVRTVVKEVLEELGAVVLVAEDGLTGIELYRQHHNRVDLILLDMQMPGLDGRQTFEQLQKINPDLKVILSSGYSESETIHAFSKEDFLKFLQKPYRFEKLAAEVRMALAAKTPQNQPQA